VPTATLTLFSPHAQDRRHRAESPSTLQRRRRLRRTRVQVSRHPHRHILSCWPPQPYSFPMQVSIERLHSKLAGSRSPHRLPHLRTTRSSLVRRSRSTPVRRLRRLHVASEDLPLRRVIALQSTCQSCHPSESRRRVVGHCRPRFSAAAACERSQRAGHWLWAALPTGLAWLWATCAALCQWATCTMCSWADGN
jgi:hypothetical protein